MANAKKIVLVEGESDKSFFEAVCKILVLDTNIQVAPPRDTTLPIPIKFKEIHRSKAEVATWLAWQKKPGHGPYSALEDSCIDSNSAQFTQLASWLRQVFE